MITDIYFIPNNTQITVRLSVEHWYQIPQLSEWITAYDNTINVSQSVTLVEISLLKENAAELLKKLSENHWIAPDKLGVFLTQFDTSSHSSSSSNGNSPDNQESIFLLAVKSPNDLLPLLLNYMNEPTLCSSKNHETVSDEIITKLLLANLKDDTNLNAEILDAILTYSPSNQKQIQLIDLLLDKVDINWNYLNKKGNSFVHTAALMNPSYLRIFCQKGLDINTRDRSGLSALHHLALQAQGMQPNFEAANLLFALGINPFIRGDFNDATYPISNATALQLAHIYAKHDLIPLIRHYIQDYVQTHECLPQDSIASQEEDIALRRLGMPKICDKIKSDLITLENLMSALRQSCCVIIFNGQPLSGEDLELYRQALINSHMQKYRPLKGMLASKVIPEHYTSVIDNQKYSRTPEEARSNKLLGNAKHAVFCKKKSRKAGENPYSLFSLHQDNGNPISHFNIEHRADKKYPHGGFSDRVKKGFIENDAAPNYAIKIFKKRRSDNSNTLRLAMRGAFCSRLLGGTGLVFREHDKHYLVTDWYNGLPLSKATPEFLSQIPIEKRIKFALDLTRQLSVLHHHGLILGDIKHSNVMISLDSIHLIDLDSAILKGEKIRAFTLRFLDHKLNYAVKYNDYCSQFFDEKSDLYALGLTLTFLFPDLFSITKTSYVIQSPYSEEQFEYLGMKHTKGRDYNSHKELFHLLLKLMSRNKNDRPDSAEHFLIQLNVLATNHYQQNIDLDTLSPPLRLNDNPKLFAETSFEEIETELHEYSQRLANFRC